MSIYYYNIFCVLYIISVRSDGNSKISFCIDFFFSLFLFISLPHLMSFILLFNRSHKDFTFWCHKPHKLFLFLSAFYWGNFYSSLVTSIVRINHPHHAHLSIVSMRQYIRDWQRIKLLFIFEQTIFFPIFIFFFFIFK